MPALLLGMALRGDRRAAGQTLGRYIRHTFRRNVLRRLFGSRKHPGIGIFFIVLVLVLGLACSGDAGVDGALGAAGPSGPVGAQGAAGPAGPAGAAGAQGVVGPAGPAGTQGEAGPTGSSLQVITEFIRWDIVSLAPPDDLVSKAGGTATARDQAGNSITLTGSGTFGVPEEGVSSVVSGGGTWETADGSGTYQVTGLSSWHLAPGTLPTPPLTDAIGDSSDTRAGLAVLTIEYSDGSLGVMTISCKLPTTPAEIAATMFEGVTISKDFLVYWDRDEPALSVDADRTIFHVINQP